MTLQLKPETEPLVREEINRGHFHTVDELIVEGVQAWREKHHAAPSTAASPTSGLKPRKRLYDLLTQAPFSGSGLNLERQKDTWKDHDSYTRALDRLLKDLKPAPAPPEITKRTQQAVEKTG